MNCVYRMHVRGEDGVGRTSPCVFSTEELAFKWADKYNTNRDDWTLEMILVDNYNQSFV